MRKLVFLFAAALAAGGCSSDVSEVSTASAAKSTSADLASGQRPAQAPVVRTAFASLPDTGVLVAYDARGVQRGNAYTLHPVRLSESHALNALAPGRSITFQDPDGRVQAIRYSRHEESVDGNWTWIGKTADGMDAIITFGADAVFGRIDRAGEAPLRITMRGGKSWLMEALPGRLLDGDLLRDADDSDVLIPRTAAVQAAARDKAASAAASAKTPVLAAAPANATNTVDVAVGFTDGLVTKYGTESAATTRISNLVALTNQAYINSLVEPRVRLVRTVRVAYTDTNDNEIALEALSGTVCTTTSCSSQPVPTELQPLVAARDTYGADLVSLVRPFRAPQQNGCGIAWLLGGGGLAIDNSDAPFGYSVVSDGDDVDETDGRNYFCREETLAHELGHNMGQQHNVEDSGGDSGTHSYSYGYREATTVGFYTVMAYRLSNSSQFPIAYFGNPSVNYPSTTRPTGTATADNARSLNQSMLLVSQFRASVVPFGVGVKDDMNGDGRSDILWRRPASNQTAVWQMNGAAVTGYTFGNGQAGYAIVATGDFNADGLIDILWDNGGTLILWTSTGTNFTAATVTSYGDGWRLAAVADANGDGRVDIIWTHPTQGQMAYWFMNGSAVSSYGFQGALLGYTIIGAGDFNGDGRFDLLWDNGGTLYLWTSTGTTFTSSLVASYGDGWKPEAVADVNGDNRMDIIWRQLSQNQIAYWFMNGATVTSYGFRAGLAGYNIIGTGDFNGDGRFDLLWDNTGTMYVWLSTGTDFTSSLVASYGDGWEPWRNALKRQP